MKKLLLWTIPLLALAVAAFVWARGSREESGQMPNGKQYFVATDGNAGGDGSMQRPWDFRTALLGPPVVKPGDIVNLRAGTYVATEHEYFHSKLAGATDKPVLVQPFPGEHVIVAGGIEIDGPWVIFRDFEVTSDDTDRLSTQPTSFPTDVLQFVGFNVFASNVKVINNIVHDNSAGIDAWAEAPDNEFYGNLIYYNGWQQAQDGKMHGHGHGLYMQNISGSKNIEDNVIFDQVASGMQLYGSEKADLNNFHVEGNIVFNNGILNKEHSRNILIGGGKVAKSPVVKDNYMYFPPQDTLGGDHNIGYNPFGVGCTDLKFTGNYIASDGPALNLYKCTVSQLKNNTFYGELKGFTEKDYPDNKFYDRSHPPNGIDVFVRPNRYEAGRANIVIFNWNHADSVKVDLASAGLNKGDAYELHSVEDYFGDVTPGIFDGSPITVSMTHRSVAKPSGIDAPPSTFPEFGAFVVRKAQQGAAASAGSSHP